MVLAPFYRQYDLPWEGDPDSSRRFRRLLFIGLALFAVMGILVPLLHLPEVKQTATEAVPERLARLMLEEKPKPPPPKPIEQPKPETRPEPKPQPDRTEEARKQAEKSLSRVKDQLADLRRDLVKDLPTQARNLTGAVGAESKAERSLITSKVGSGSAGVQSTNSSRGFGTGAGSLTGHSTGAVNSTVAGIGGDNKATRTGNSGKAARSQEEIELEFDRQKGAIYALYARALRERADLQGKLVLEFTIAPSGEVVACRVVSSELNDPELERRIVARVKQIRFPARDVEAITTTKPIEFFPG
ncbi:MAG: AgmX/PglI C-terminal domain-containing protein [Pseudomonadota bacterium]